MSKRALILVEGQTEEQFVKNVLAPELHPLDLFFEQPKILVTNIVKNGPNFKGGVTNYEKFRRDLTPLLRSGGALVTTILDYYGLPSDFPGMRDRPPGSPLDRVLHVERAIWEDVGSPRNFVPFLALHEFEAWLFSSPDELPKAMTMMEKQPQFQAIRNAVATPEEIDDGPTTALSKRILALFPGYRKPLHGPRTAQRIGIARIRSECPRTSRAGFGRWRASRDRNEPRSSYPASYATDVARGTVPRAAARTPPNQPAGMPALRAPARFVHA